jgi:putative restriction endonuclease
MHTLYDGGYISVNPQHRLRVSPRLREEFHNGDDLYARAARRSRYPNDAPTDPAESPSSGTSTRCSSPADC